jgi:hypothetical protein
MRRRLPVLPESLLDDIQIATPCSADWSAMTGDERVRHCPDCKLNVYNVAAMSRREAGLLIREREGRLCLRLFRRSDGTLITADCWDKVRAARRRGHIAFACAIMLAALIRLGIGVAVARVLLDHFAGESHPAEVNGGIRADDFAPLGGMAEPTPDRPKPPHHRMGKLKRSVKDQPREELGF